MRFILLAQAVAQLASNPAVQPGERLVSIDVNRESIESVVRSISAQTGVPIAYGDALRQSKTRVTAKLKGIPVRVALSQVLAGTQLTANRSADGKGFVVERYVARTSASKAQGMVAGKITDAKTGKGISGASISLGNDTRGVASGEDGSYRLNGVVPGVHTIVVRIVGYAKQTRSITVDNGSTITIDFKLEASTNVLDQVVVTGTATATELKAVPNAITVITAKQIEEKGITKIEQLFRGDVPGVFAPNQGSSASALLDQVLTYSRGATSLTSGSPANFTNPLKTYVDGVELANPSYMNQIDPKSIERIEILTGPQASTIYGSNAINGVMQIFTKRGIMKKTQITATILTGLVENNFSNARTPQHDDAIRVNGLTGRISYNTGGSWVYTGPWSPGRQLARFGNDGGAHFDATHLVVDMTMRQGLTTNKRKGSAAQFETERYASGQYIYSSGLSPNHISKLRGHTQGASIRFLPMSWWTHEVVLGSDAANVETVTQPISSGLSDTIWFYSETPLSRVSQRFISTIQAPESFPLRGNVTIGIDHWMTRSSSLGGQGMSLTGALSGASVTRDRPGKNSGAFLQGQLNVKDRMFFTYGLRAEWNPNFGENAQPNIAPRFGAVYTQELADATVKIRASYGRSTRPPSNGQKSATPVNSGTAAVYGPVNIQSPNPDLAPEFQQGGEGGIEVYLGSRASLVITRYNQTVDGLIGSVSPIDSTRSILPHATTNCGTPKADGYCYLFSTQNLNVGSIRNQGWETQATINFGPFTTTGTYSWTKSRILGITPRYRSLLTGSQYQPGRSFSWFPEHNWGLKVGYAHRAATVTLSAAGSGFLYRSLDVLSDPIGITRLSVALPRASIPSGYRGTLAGYSTVDLNAMYRMTGHVEGILQVRNLSNNYQNDISISFASLGRQVKAGFRLR